MSKFEWGIVVLIVVGLAAVLSPIALSCRATSAPQKLDAKSLEWLSECAKRRELWHCKYDLAQMNRLREHE